MKRNNKMSQLIFQTNYLGSKVIVHDNRLEWKMLFQKQSIPINQIASVDTTIPLYAGVVIETTGGKKYRIPVKLSDKKKLEEAIYKAQEKSQATNSGKSNNLNDLEKLAELKKKGIITKEEFEAKKKKILEL